MGDSPVGELYVLPLVSLPFMCALCDTSTTKNFFPSWLFFPPPMSLQTLRIGVFFRLGKIFRFALCGSSPPRFGHTTNLHYPQTRKCGKTAVLCSHRKKLRSQNKSSKLLQIRYIWKSCISMLR